MILFHGTSSANLPDMSANGVNSESYWGTFEQARNFASSFDDGIVIQSDIDTNDLQASLLMAEPLYENGDIDVIPESDDIEYSLEFLGGCLCLIPVYDFSIVE